MASHQSPISRRAFVAGSAAAGLAGGCRPAHAESESAVRQASNREYVDIHVHLTHRWYGSDRGPVSADILLRWMDAHDVAQAAVLPLVSPEAFWYPITTEFVLSQTKNHADRLIPFCAIDPRTLGTHLTTQKHVVDMLRRYIDAGAKGFGEHKVRLPIDDPLSMGLYEACAEVRLPLLFHLDNRSNMDKPGLPGLEKVLKSFPDLSLIGHGKGWWASISGNLQQADLHASYPQGPVAPGGAIDALMEKYSNLYGDLSSSGAHAVLRDQGFGEKFLVRRADKLLFGTDYYDLKQRSFQQFDLFRELSVPDHVQARISRDNARRLLGLM